MGKIRHAVMFAILTIAIGATVVMAAPPAPADMLRFQPKQPDVVISTPKDTELANCKVELSNGPGSASGWLLKDPNGLPLRKFVASKGAKASIDVWSYYLDGQEVYREIDTTGKGKPDQYRWFGAGGMRWGVDVNQDGRIDGWKMISAEEVSQEALKAIATRDAARFQVLLINAEELKALQLPAAESDRVRQAAAQSVGQFQKSVQSLNLSPGVTWKHLDVQAPQCLPAEQTGAAADVIRYKNATIFYEAGDKHDFISLGEVIQVGRAWRLIAGPTPGSGGAADVETASGPNVPDALKPVIDQIQKLDKNAPQVGATPQTIGAYNMQRAGLLEQIVAGVPAKDAEAWVKQLADCLGTAAQNAGSDKAAQIRLVALRDNLAKSQPAGSPLLGYIEYRVISTEYTAKMNSAKGNDSVKVQDWWRDKLKDFVTAYKTAEDAPEAAIQLAMVSEFMGKETEAKNWYTQVTKDYPQNPVAVKAAGALKRLGLEGQVLELAGPTFAGQQFNIAQARGKIVIAFYWASWNASAIGDFAKLQDILKNVGSKGVELVTVNLDDNPQSGAKLIANVPGQHIYAAGGLNGAVANNHGIMVLPNIFLVGADGKVASRTVQMSGLEDEIKKLLEK